MATGALGHSYMRYLLLAFKNPKRVQDTTTETSIINIEQEFGLKKYTETSNSSKTR